MQNRVKLKTSEIRARMHAQSRDAIEKRMEDPRRDARPLMKRVVEQMLIEQGWSRGKARDTANRLAEAQIDRIGYRMSDDEYAAIVLSIRERYYDARLIDTDFDEDEFGFEGFRMAV